MRSSDLHLAAVLLLFPLLPTSYGKGKSPRASCTMLPFIQGRLRVVALSAFKNPTGAIIYLKSTGWSNTSLSPRVHLPTRTPGAALGQPQPPLWGEIPAGRRWCRPLGWDEGVCSEDPSHSVCGKEKRAGLQEQSDSTHGLLLVLDLQLLL